MQGYGHLTSKNARSSAEYEITESDMPEGKDARLHVLIETCADVSFFVIDTGNVYLKYTAFDGKENVVHIGRVG